MKNAYAGGPVEAIPQQTVLGQMTLASSKDFAHQLVDYVGEQFGYGTVVLILIVGAVVLAKKRSGLFGIFTRGGKTDGK